MLQHPWQGGTSHPQILIPRAGVKTDPATLSVPCPLHPSLAPHPRHVLAPDRGRENSGLLGLGDAFYCKQRVNNKVQALSALACRSWCCSPTQGACRGQPLGWQPPCPGCFAEPPPALALGRHSRASSPQRCAPRPCPCRGTFVKERGERQHLTPEGRLPGSSVYLRETITANPAA